MVNRSCSREEKGSAKFLSSGVIKLGKEARSPGLQYCYVLTLNSHCLLAGTIPSPGLDQGHHGDIWLVTRKTSYESLFTLWTLRTGPAALATSG